jgi:acetyl esterase/lipase
LINRRVFLGGALTAAAARDAAAGPRVTTIDYGPAKLDIHDPAPGRKLPVLVYLHGGAWQAGSRRDVDRKPGFFRGLGFLFVAADYRLGPFNKPDRQAWDVAAAYVWVRENIVSFGGDASRIVVMGHSSGSHLTALAALRGDMPGAAGLILNDIQMYDIAKFAGLNGGHLPRHYGYLFGSGKRWAELSPVTHLGAAPVPPTLVAWSNMRLSRELSLDFAARLKAAGVRVSAFDGTAYRHREIDRRIGAEEGGMSGAVSAFLRRAT